MPYFVPLWRFAMRRTMALDAELVEKTQAYTGVMEKSALVLGGDGAGAAWRLVLLAGRAADLAEGRSR
jgi:hypothetical protein